MQRQNVQFTKIEPKLNISEVVEDDQNTSQRSIVKKELKTKHNYD